MIYHNPQAHAPAPADPVRPSRPPPSAVSQYACPVFSRMGWREEMSITRQSVDAFRSFVEPSEFEWSVGGRSRRYDSDTKHYILSLLYISSPSATGRPSEVVIVVVVAVVAVAAVAAVAPPPPPPPPRINNTVSSGRILGRSSASIYFLNERDRERQVRGIFRVAVQSSECASERACKLSKTEMGVLACTAPTLPNFPSL